MEKVSDHDRIKRLRDYKKAIASYKILKTCEFKLAARDAATPVESDLNMMTPIPDDEDDMMNLGYPPLKLNVE